jgi:hypothetical protein
MRSRCFLCVHVCVRVCVSVCPPWLLGNCSVNVPLTLLGNGSVKFLPIVARQRLSRNVTTVRNTHATIEELGFEVLTAVVMKNIIFWDKTLPACLLVFR